MYLHLGKNVVVAKKDIVTICDLDNTSQSHITRAYLAAAEKNSQVVNVSDDLPKSFVVCTRDDGAQVLYLSQLASATLLKRAETLSIE
ncbi:MAG: DUF370 domain-containing protein [Clostridiales bacterium]|jgi:hypothetical protein|nr:DUF370 domain-containing protein [Clostridiales bacterium]